MGKIILHIDFDSFFASVEQFDHPELRGKPIGVTAATSRSAIIAASIEAKKYGIRGGSSSQEGLALCPSLQLVSAHFPRYFAVSKEFLKICRLYSPYIEVFSIDELFMDVTSTAPLFGGIEKLISLLKRDIKKNIGECITVSVGISYNKLLAKLASEMDKPNGSFLITPENVDEIYARIDLTDICGIGRGISKRLHMLGITNLLKLRQVSLAKLTAEFGPHEANFLEDVAWAKDATEVVHFGHGPSVKSVGRNYCLPHNEYNSRVVLQNLFELCEEISIKLRRLEKKARTVGLSLRGNMSWAQRVTTQHYMDTGKELFEVCVYLYYRDTPYHARQGVSLLGDNGYVRQMSVWASGLADSTSIPHSLFDDGGRQERLIKAIDAINEKFGDHTIRNGFLLYSDKLTTVPNGFLADRWDRLQLTKLY